MHYSARSLIGLAIYSDDSHPHQIGTVESITISPETMLMDGFLIGRVGLAQNQVFLPRECAWNIQPHAIVALNRTLRRPSESRRVLGLQAWTTHPHFLVGFVHDFSFSLETGEISAFSVHQLLRTWHVPASAVVKVTPKALLIENDTTIKLKLTPFPQAQ